MIKAYSGETYKSLRYGQVVDGVSHYWTRQLKLTENKFFFISALHLIIHILLFTGFLFVQKDHLFLNLHSWVLIYQGLLYLFIGSALGFYFYEKVKNSDAISYGCLFLNSILFTMVLAPVLTVRPEILILIYLFQILCAGWVKAYRGAFLMGLTLSFLFFLLLIFNPLMANEMSLSSVFILHSLMFLFFSLLSGFFGAQLNKMNWTLKATQRQIYSLEHLNHLIADNVPLGVLITNDDGEVIHLNRKGYSILSVSELEESFSVELPKEIKTHLDVCKEKWIREGAIMGSSFKSRLSVLQESHSVKDKLSSDRDLKTLEVLSSPFRDSETGGWNTLLVFQDITLQVEKNRQTKQKDKMAAIGRMAAGIAQEFKKPLSGISASLQLMDLNNKNGKENKKLMDQALGETKRLNNIVMDFLDYASPHPLGGVPGQSTGEVDVNALLDDITDHLSLDDFALKGRLSLDITLTSKGLFYGNSDLVKQAFLNVIKNARDSVVKRLEQKKEEEVLGLLKIRTYDKADRVVVQVEDNGVGFKERKKEQLFEPFYTTKENGTGLGLPMAKKIVESQAGVLSLTSEGEGKGAHCEMIWKVGPRGRPEVGKIKKIDPKICA